MLKGSGGNIGVITGNDGVLIVDDQYAPLVPKIKAAIAEISDKPVKYVINTHWHGDHMGGNEVFGADGSIIIAHENVRTRISTDQFMKHQQRAVPASPEAAWPVVTFSDEITYYFNDEEIWVRHAPPAHTDGDAAIYFKNANVIHMGDAFVRYGYPFVDISSGGSVTGMADNLDHIIEMTNESTIVIPGHGELSNRQDMIEFRDILRDIVAGVQQGIDAGKTLEEIQSSDIASKYDEQWGGGFIKGKDFMTFTYLSLKPE
jgi:glyoxylase-like metal-dependent hydrolase (beta-lactamase superfamily II)